VVAASQRDGRAKVRGALDYANLYAPPGVPLRGRTLEERRRDLSLALACTSIALVIAVVLLAIVAWLLHALSARKGSFDHGTTSTDYVAGGMGRGDG
jgi:hypothetical protein